MQPCLSGKNCYMLPTVVSVFHENLSNLIINFLPDFKFLQPVTARLSSTLPGYAATKCIDGDEISVTHGTSLCHSSGASAPWLAVDYGTSVSIRWVEIFNRRDCCGDRTKNVNVRVSDDLPTTDKQMFSGGALLGQFAGPGTDGQHIVISGHRFNDTYIYNRKRNIIFFYLVIIMNYYRWTVVWQIHHFPNEQQ